MDTTLLLRLALALCVGLLVGVERGWRQREAREGGRVAGVRTFALVGLAGGVSALLSGLAGGPWAWLIVLALLTAVFALFGYREGAQTGDVSVTTLVAAMLTFLLGVTAVAGDMRAAAAGAVVTAGVLASRNPLHRAVARLSWVELRAALLLLAMTVIVLPVLPDAPIDPLSAVNPREIWLLTSLTAAISYAGYVALKLAGPEKGPLLAGLAGGLTSSTATTIALARHSRGATDAGPLAAGASLSSAVSLVRASFLGIVAEPALAPLLAPAAGAAAAAFALAGALPLLRRGKATARPAEVGTPFELSTVLGFGLLLTAITFVGAWITRELGVSGAYLFSAISGLVDVDAVTLAQARAASRGGSTDVAAIAILIALAANGAARAAYAFAFGSRAFGLRLSLFTAAAAAAGTAGAAAGALFG